WRPKSEERMIWETAGAPGSRRREFSGLVRVAPGRREDADCRVRQTGGARSMIADAPRRIWRRTRDSRQDAVPARAGRATVPVIEALEARELLSFYNGPSATRPVITNAGLFLIQVSGPGVVNVHPAAD